MKITLLHQKLMLVMIAEDPTVKSSESEIAVLLMKYCNEIGTFYPSQRLLAKLLRKKNNETRHVRRLISSLIKKGWLRVVRRGNTLRGSNLYQFAWEKLQGHKDLRTYMSRIEGKERSNNRTYMSPQTIKETIYKTKEFVSYSNIFF